MKPIQHDKRDSRSQRPQWPLLLFIGLCAGGAGATGALMWAQSRAPQSSSQSSSQSSAPYEPIAPPGAASSTSGESHEPPPSLTTGMAPAQAALTLGNWHYDQEHWDVAVEHYQRAIAGGLDNPNVRTDMGNAMRFAGEPRKALEQYQIAQRQDPTHQQSLFNQGGLWAFSMGDKAKGVAAWRKYLRAFPQGQSAQAARELMAQVGAKP